MVVNELHGRQIPNGVVCPLLINILCVRPQSRPGPKVRYQCLFKHSSRNVPLQLSIKRVLDRLPRLDEVQHHPLLTGPRIQRCP
jgi:hypothetical protein